MITYDIMIDMDDVIVPWFDTVDAGCRAAWGHDFPPCTNWHMWEHYGRTEEEWVDIVIQATQTGLYHTVEPIPGSIEAINRLRFDGHRAHIYTARGFMSNGQEIRDWTVDYLENFGIGHDSLVFAKDKAAAMRENGLHFDFAADDGMHNYRNLSEAGVEIWLVSAVHNSLEVVERRVDSLWEFAQIVERRAKEAS